MEANSKVPQVPAPPEVISEVTVPTTVVEKIPPNSAPVVSNNYNIPTTMAPYYSYCVLIPANYPQVQNISQSYPIQLPYQAYPQNVYSNYYANPNTMPISFQQMLHPQIQYSIAPTQNVQASFPQYERIHPANPKEGVLSSFFNKIYSIITGKTRNNWREIENAKFIAPPKARILAGNLEYKYRNTSVKKIKSPRRALPGQLSPRQISPRYVSPRRLRVMTPQEGFIDSNYAFEFPNVEKGSFFDV